MFGGNKRMTLGNNRRRDPISKKQIMYLVIVAVIIFLSIWQMPIKQKIEMENITPPTPTEVK
jgi:hypothetical protein